jgi:hypothetical protein
MGMIVAVVDEKQDPDPDKYERLVRERDQAEAQLRAELLPEARRAGVPVEQLAELVKLRELAPAEFQRMHREACRISAESEARLLKLKQAAKQLKEVIQAESATEDPFRLHRARVQLQELNALIKQMEKQ